MDIFARARSIGTGRYDEIANLMYKDLMEEKYPNDDEYQKQIKIDRSGRVTSIAVRLRRDYENKLQLRSVAEKLTKQDKLDIAVDAYTDVEEYFRHELNLPDRTRNL
jgi:hypothetical protein